MAMLEVVAHLRANADNMVSGFRRAQDSADNFGQSVQRQSGIVRSGFSIMSKAAILGGGAMQTAAMMGAKMGIGFAMANEQAIISFKTLLGSQAKAEAMFKDLQTFAASTPFEFPQLRDAASKLLTTGVAAERVKPILTAIGDSTAAMGTGAEGIAAATRALQQMNLVGKVTGQDMMQLANAGIPAWATLAAAANMSVADVKKAVEQGKLDDSVGKLMSGLENYSGEAMGRVKGMMAEQSKTLTGLMSTLKDNINIALGDMMKPATEAIKNAMPAINDAIGKVMKGMVTPIGNMVTVFMDGFQKLIPSIEPMMTAVSTIAVAIATAIVPLVTQLAAALPALQPLFLSIGESITALSTVFAPLISQILVGFIPAVMVISTVLQTFTGFLSEHKAVLEALTPVVGGLVAAYIGFKAVGKINALFGSAKAIWGMVAAVLANTGATGAQATATGTAAVASTALMVAQAEMAVAAAVASGSETALATATAAQAAATTAAATATKSLNVALISNPIGLVIAAVVGLAIAVVLMYQKFEWFRRGLKGIWNSVVSIVQVGINLILGYITFMGNKYIDVINLLIKGYNMLPFHKDVKPMKHMHLSLDITGAKLENATAKAKKLAAAAKAAAVEVSAADFRKFEGFQPIDSKAKDKGKGEGTGGGAGGGGAGAGADALKALVAAAKKLGTDSVSKATKFFEDIKKQADDFSKSIKDSIMAVFSFSNAMSRSVASQDNYQSALDAVAVAEKAVGDALRTRDIAGYTKATEDYAKASENLATAEKNKMSFMDSLKKQYEDAKAFGDILTRLREAGLGQAGISQVVAAGAEAGTKIGLEILAGGTEAVSNANTWYKELLKSSDDAAKGAKEQFYKQGLSQGEQLVKGITDAAKKLNLSLTSKGLTAAQVKNLEKNFGVSIGFKMSSLSEMASGIPQMANGGIVRARSGGTLALLGEAGRDEAVIPLGKGGMGGSNTYHITVQAGIGDEQAIARQLVSVLQSYEKRSGRIPIRTN